MKKIAVFGNAGGGKSTLSARLAEVTGSSLFALDIIQFRDPPVVTRASLLRRAEKTK
jgi:adenylate kinase family enzyme